MELSKRQIEIIEASGKLLMEKGILGLTTKNISQEMNFTESALYRHFKNKEEIISFLILYLAENINARFDAILNSKLNPEEKFLEVFKSQLRFFKTNPHFIVIVLSDGLMDNSEDVKNSIKTIMQTNAIAFKSIIEEGQRLKIFKENIGSEYLVHFSMASFRLKMLKWKLENFSFDIEKQGMRTMENLLTLIKN